MMLLSTASSPIPAGSKALHFKCSHGAFDIAVYLVEEAVRLAVTASMINARAERRILKPIQDLQQYFPQRGIDLVAAGHGEDAPIFFTEALTAHVERLLRDISALILNLPEKKEAWSSPVTASTMESWVALKTQVRAVCSSLRILLLVIGDRLIAVNDTIAGQLLEADHLLKAVLRGQSPCVRSDGQVIIPRVDDRRRERRIPMNLRVDLLCERGSFRPLLRDISPSGFGLSDAPALTINTQVAVQLPTQRMLVGMVRWSHGSNSGIRLLNQLPIDDELLQSAWVTARQR